LIQGGRGSHNQPSLPGNMPAVSLLPADEGGSERSVINLEGGYNWR
jgi:hypothetical protein